ncbi:xanthine-guanine phosphoribosyltransferase [mine drainage metagenome]|uniref:Xanthine-guanine phosphoribosyltransferase n=2 Tax=mine drainage metagenome TaxID=410659 RepID=T1B200_9ZZZZ
MQFKARLVTWEEIVDWCLSLRSSIVVDYQPDSIIGLSRGGLVPARLLSDYLWIKDLFSVKTEHWGITASKDGEARISADVSLPVKGRKVLIVDDITDTGSSMKLAVDTIKKLGPASIKTSTMLHIEHSTYVPDYYAAGVSAKEWTWFIFPWNVYEDVLNLSGKVMQRPMQLIEISTALRENFGLELERGYLQELLKNFAMSGKVKPSGDRWELPNIA